MLNLADIVEQYGEQFDTHPLLVRACGRINIIGEHTDYNEGYVLPASVDKHIFFALAENGTEYCQLHAANLGDSYRFNIHEMVPCEKGWANHLMGILQQFQKAGIAMEGIDCVFGGDLPIGSGMSSSAALECGFALGICALFNLEMSRKDLALLAQRGSHEFVGIPCGIMDQFASLMGREGQAIKLDCRSLSYEYIPLELGDFELVLVNSKVSHELGNSAYGQRVAECRAGVAVLQQHFPEVNSLRDASLDMLEQVRAELGEVVYRRCIYVVKENSRLLEACDCLSAGDMEGLGRLLLETHAGLRDEYEVSCAEIDFLVDFAAAHPACLGSRVMGGGFGGSTISLVKREAVPAFCKEIETAYRKKYGIKAATYLARVVDGTSTLRAGQES